MSEVEQEEGIIASRYEELSTYRLPFLQRARDVSEITIPFLVPPEGHNGATGFQTPYQSLSARGINNLAGKLLMTLFPPATTFFRLVASEGVIQEAEKVNPDAATVIDAGLGKVEQSILKEIEIRGFRVSCFEALRHLIVAGNVLIFLPAKSGIRVFPLDQFVVCRDPEGNLTEIIVKEMVSPKMLPDDVTEQVQSKLKSDERSVPLYTRVYLDGTTWKTSQEVKGTELPESKGSYPKDKLPWLALRWTRVHRDEYGRGLGDEYFGDLLQLEGLAKAVRDFAFVAAKKIPMVEPGGMTDITEFAEAETGQPIPGRAADVTWSGVEKYPDFQVIQTAKESLEQRLSYVFLLNSAIQRDAERVTAEEIRYMAQELENALGGVYSVLAEEFQLPVVMIVWNRLIQQNRLPPLPKDSVSPAIVTGLDALGRASEASRLDELIATAAQEFGPQIVAQYVNPGEWFRRKATALGVNEDGLIKTDQEVQAAQQAAQQQQQAMELAKQAAPNAVTQFGQMAQNQQQQQVQPQQQGQ